MAKKTNRKKLKEKLEKLVKLYVKRRDDYTCQVCGKQVEGSNCHASHVIPVSRDGRLAFDHINLKTLCYHDHLNWWHKFPTEAGQWFIERFPDRREYLQTKYKNKPMGGIKEYWYEAKIEEMQALLSVQEKEYLSVGKL